MKSRLLLISSLLLICLTSSAQSTWYWGAAGKSGGSNPDCEGVALAIDHNSSTYLTGEFSDSLYISTNKFYSANGQTFIMKCDSNGNIMWAQQGASSVFTSGRGIACDNKDNIYCVGEFETNAVFGSFTLLSSTAYVVTYLVKYNTNGTVLWAKQSGYTALNNNDAFAQNVTTDKNGNVYIMGSFKDTIQFGSVLLTTTSDAMYVAKFDSSGNLIWAKQSQGAPTITALTHMSLSADALSNVYIDFLFNGSITVGSSSFSSINNSGIVAKLDSNGTIIWAKQITASGGLGCNSILAGYDHQVYLTGTYSTSLKYGTFTLNAPNSYADMFLMKMDTAGNLTWCKTSGGMNSSNCTGYKVTMDSLYHLYISAGILKANPDTVVFDSMALNCGVNNSSDGPSIILKLDSAGHYLCGVMIPAGGDDINALCVTPSGKGVFLGGDLWNSFRFGTDSIPLNTGEIPFIARWKSCAACDAAVTVSPLSPSVCKGQSVTLTAGGEPNYTWSPAIGLNTTTGSSVIVTDTSTTTYTIVGTGGCNTDTAQVVVTVLPSPNKPTISKQGDVLTSSATQGNQWLVNDTSINGATNQTYTITKQGCYSVTVINPANGCGATSDTLCLIPTGINQLSVNNNQLSIYPNPTTGQFTITTNGNQNGYKVEVFDVLGQLVYQSVITGSPISINLNSSPAGVYFVYLKSDEGVKIGKVLVTK